MHVLAKSNRFTRAQIEMFSLMIRWCGHFNTWNLKFFIGNNYYTCPPSCNNGICTAEENPWCSDQEDWGCRGCNNTDYFFNDWESPCVSCHDTFNGLCAKCVNWRGCIQCTDGSQPIWDSECDMYYCEGICMFYNCINYNFSIFSNILLQKQKTYKPVKKYNTD